MNSLRRMLDILELFTPQHPVIDVDFVCETLGYAPASAYRYVRELSDVGLLVRIPRGYTLGPRIIELDRLMTEHNPILVESREWIAHLASETGLHVLLSELYGSTVINVHQTPGREPSQLNFGRGDPMDLFHSATARVILAYLLPRQLKRMYETHAEDADLEHIGPTWKAFSKAMLQIRKQGYCISRGELDADKSGLAAPIFDEKKRVLGSITLVGGTERFDAFNQDYLIGLVTRAAAEITERISQPQ
ncbi:IclR family transcriptional regulator [Nitrogeniibacter aestuarii]|uniref:IclR family transcriptional regulator n=1 Tax=Nitrogeniibacter aestuarii TaxID=2815343 RepID=UPI001D11EF64|nr:IclR family transcriptional regulator [Nitrogeniibacter aestuarii]